MSLTVLLSSQAFMLYKSRNLLAMSIGTRAGVFEFLVIVISGAHTVYCVILTAGITCIILIFFPQRKCQLEI